MPDVALRGDEVAMDHAFVRTERGEPPRTSMEIPNSRVAGIPVQVDEAPAQTHGLPSAPIIGLRAVDAKAVSVEIEMISQRPGISPSRSAREPFVHGLSRPPCSSPLGDYLKSFLDG